MVPRRVWQVRFCGYFISKVIFWDFKVPHLNMWHTTYIQCKIVSRAAYNVYVSTEFCMVKVDWVLKWLVGLAGVRSDGLPNIYCVFHCHSLVYEQCWMHGYECYKVTCVIMLIIWIGLLVVLLFLKMAIRQVRWFVATGSFRRHSRGSASSRTSSCISQT